MLENPKLFAFALAVYLMGLYALAPGLLNLWLLWRSWWGGFEIQRDEVVFALNGLAMSLLPAALVFVPVARRWFLARRDTWPAEAFFWQLRAIFAAYVLYRFSVKFEPIPGPPILDTIRQPVALMTVGVYFAMATMLPGTYARHLGRETRQAAGARLKETAVDISRRVSEVENEVDRLARSAAAKDNAVRPTYRVEEARLRANAAEDHAAMAPTPAPAPQGAIRRRERVTAVGASRVTQRRRPEPSHSKLAAGALSAFLGLFAVAAFYGYRVPQFAPPPELVAAHRDFSLAILIGAAAFIAIVWPFIENPSNVRYLKSLPTLRRLAMAALIGSLLWLGSFPALVVGAPALHSLFIDPPPKREAQVTVVERSSASSRRRCDHRLKVVGEEFVGPDPIEFCGASEILYAETSPGQVLTLWGYETAYGFRYESVRR